jgi:radical SAM protein with 4Fe4S-binding SPASM domain
MTQKTHETYRVNGDLDKSLTNLVSCVEEKRRRPDSRTRIKVGFIVMKHNEHEVEEFVRFAEETGVDGYEVLHPCVRNEEQGEEFLTLDEKYWIYDKEAFSKGILRPRFGTSHYCEWLYFATTVQVNGDVVPCCRDPRGQYILGNVLEQDFVNDIWNGERYREFRHTVAHNQKDSTICNLCAGYTAPDVTRHDAPEIPLRIEVPEPDRVAV